MGYVWKGAKTLDWIWLCYWWVGPWVWGQGHSRKFVLRENWHGTPDTSRHVPVEDDYFGGSMWSSQVFVGPLLWISSIHLQCSTPSMFNRSSAYMFDCLTCHTSIYSERPFWTIQSNPLMRIPVYKWDYCRWIKKIKPMAGGGRKEETEMHNQKQEPHRQRYGEKGRFLYFGTNLSELY